MEPPKSNSQNKAIARKLGLDSPEGVTAFISQFKSSYPTNIMERTEPLYPQVKEELVSRLAEQRVNDTSRNL